MLAPFDSQITPIPSVRPLWFFAFRPLSNERTQKAFLHWASVEEPSRCLNFIAKSLSALHPIVRMRPTIISDLMSAFRKSVQG